MNAARLPLLAFAMIGCAILGSHGLADETESKIRFAAPVRIKAGDAFLGEGRYYPSPVLHDINGDKRLDLVVGDLIGRVTVAQRSAAKSPVAFGAEQPLNDRDGQPLKFANW